MSKSVIVLVALTLASTGASAYFWQELKTERQSSEVLEQRIAQLERSQKPAPSASVDHPIPPPPESGAPPTPSNATREPQLQPPPPVRPVAAFGVVGTAGPVGNAEMQRRFRDAREQQQRLMQDPEYRELMRAQQKLSMGHMYADLEALLGLTKEEAEQLRDVLAEQQLKQMEHPSMHLSADTPPDEAKVREMQQRIQEIERKNQSEIAALLGPRYADWQNYQQNSWSRMQVTQLRQNLATTEEPLRSDQLKPLVDALAREQKSVEQEMRAQAQVHRPTDPASHLRMQEEWLERQVRTNERVRAAVSSLLSPTQLERLTQQQDQQIKMQQVHLRLQRAREEARARGELPPDSENGVVALGSSATISVR